MLYASRGTGKTFISLSIAYAVGAGGKLFDRWEVQEPAKVLYIDGEMPAVVLKERLTKIASGYSRKLQSEDNLLIITPDEQPSAMPNLATKDGQASLEPFLQNVKLIIVDNLATLVRHGKNNDEESWIPVQTWLLDLRRRGFSVLLVHHAGKSGDQRGTSAKEDILDTVIKLRHPDDYQASDGARFEIHLTKARGLSGADASPFEVCLTTNSDGSLTWQSRDIDDRTAILEMYQEGMSVREIAAVTQKSKSSVGRLLKSLQESQHTK